MAHHLRATLGGPLLEPPGGTTLVGLHLGDHFSETKLGTPALVDPLWGPFYGTISRPQLGTRLGAHCG